MRRKIIPGAKRFKRGHMEPRRENCVFCRQPFITRHSQGKFCSSRCRRASNRASWRAYGDRNRSKRRLYGRSHYERTRDRLLQKTRAYHRSEAGKVAARRSAELQFSKAPEKIFARAVVSAAIRAGYLTPQPCQVCGAKKVEAHHPDYMEPFKVEWLCRAHHLAEHKRLNQPGHLKQPVMQAAE